MVDFTKVGQRIKTASGGVVLVNEPPGPVMKLGELDRTAAVARMEDHRRKVDSVVAAIKFLEVTDDASNREMSANVLIATKLVKAVSGQVDTLIAPAKEFMAFVKNFGKGFTSPLAVQLASGKNKIGTYASRLELERRKEEALLRRQHEERQKELDKDAKKSRVAPVTLPPPVIKREKKVATQTVEGKTSVSYKWVAKIVDADKVPREYCSPDPAKLRDAVKAGRREGINGVEIVQEAQVRTYVG
jgi:hypothetical protein